MDASDLGLLLTLNALLQEASVSGAAKRLALSTSAVSHALARLRDRLNDPLLVRAGGRMVLTPRAEVLLPQVRDLVHAAERLFEPPETFDPRQLKRTFTINVTDYLLVLYGDRLEEILQTQAPHLVLRILPSSADEGELLRRGESDLTIGAYRDLEPELRTRPLLRDRLVCAVRVGHPVLGETMTPERFVQLGHVQVCLRGRPGGYLDELLEARGLSRRIVRAVPQFQMAIAITARSDFMLTTSERMIQSLGSKYGLVTIDPPFPLPAFTLKMVWHPRYDGDSAHAWFRERLIDTVQ